MGIALPRTHPLLDQGLISVSGLTATIVDSLSRFEPDEVPQFAANRRGE